MKKLSGRVALITGAGRGIGRATGALFSKQGADLILISRTAGELEETAGICRKNGAKVHVGAIDLSDKIQIDTFFRNLPEPFRKIEILINNAARFDLGLMHEYDYYSLELTLKTNVIAPFYLAQKFIRNFKGKAGAIVNISSYSGCLGTEKFRGFGGYNISKYALWGLTEILALENKAKCIRVNQLSPSGVDTRMFREANPPGVEADLSPDEVAEKILYLASDDSYPLSGNNIMMDGMPSDQ